MKIEEMRINGGGDDDEAPAAVRTVKELAPDPTAMIFWLKNRNPARWRDRPEHSETEDETDLNITLTVVDASKDANA